MKYYKKGNSTEAITEALPVTQPSNIDVVDAKDNGTVVNGQCEQPRLGFSSDYDVIKERPSEKRKVDFHDKLVLSPLTTVGNLPFRRIAKEFGADITCGTHFGVFSSRTLV